MRLILLIFAFLIASCSQDTIYDLTLIDESGKKVTLKEFKGRTLIAYVWSGSCVGHTRDLKDLNGIKDTLSEGVVLISIAIMMDRDGVEEVLRKNSIDSKYPIYADPKGRLGDVVKLVFLPATLIFNEKGDLIGNYPKLPSDINTLLLMGG